MTNPFGQPDSSRRPDDDATRFSTHDSTDSSEGITDFELSEQPSASSIGLLGEYLLLEQIGKGGMGLVYRAEHRTMNRQVAIKILSGALAANPSFIEQFFAEIRAAAKLMHPNIVTAFDAGQISGTYFLAMELVEGETLASHIQRCGPLSCGEAVYVLEQAASALECAHNIGIVHRDIKPSNMMVTKEGRLKILDFGLAHLIYTPAGRSSGCIMGTPEYMAPEQFEHSRGVDGRTDLYSLGASLFFLLTGRPMFAGNDLARAQQNRLQQTPTLFTQRGDIDLRLDAIYQRLVAKDPAGRFQSATELTQTIRRQGLISSWSQQPKPTLLKGLGRIGDDPTSVASESTVIRQSQIVAIDLGMLATTAAYYDPHRGPQLIRQGDSGDHLRNMIWSTKDQLKIGSSASEMRQKSPQLAVHSLQRWIGAEKLDRPICGELTPPEVGLAAILKLVMQHAASQTEKTNAAVVTVPACYDQTHRRSIRDACRIAGIELVQLLDKPLAAGLNWLDVNARLLQTQSQGAAISSQILYVHLGGTGLEAACLKVGDNHVQMQSASGDWKLGSQRWQHLLTEYFSGVLQQQTGRSIKEDANAATRLQRTIEFAMERLTRLTKVEVRFDWMGSRIEQTITQHGLVKIAPNLCSSIEQVMREACEKAGIELSKITHLLLAGSMFHMRPLREVVTNQLARTVDVNLVEKSDLARGAALHIHGLASMLQSKSDSVLRGHACTVYPIALLPEFEGLGSKPRELVAAGQPLPTSISRTIRPSGGSQQTRIIRRMSIIEGTRLGENNWHLLTEAVPAALFPGRDPDAPLLLNVEVDESGLMSANLTWPDGNMRSVLPATLDRSLSSDEILRWRQWLETALLCSSD
ncbi:MAG: Hsp70 family protein [Pirellulales bacterium]